MKVLVVEDDRAVRDALDRALRSAGAEVITATDGLEALTEVRRSDPDLVILDLGLPGMDGLAVCRRLRADADPRPVLMLTARDGVDDRVAGLDVGADDYLVKPFALEELLARVRALLRRTAAPDPTGTDVLQVADLLVDRATREVTRAGRPVTLTDLEFRLLVRFAEHPRVVLTREALLEHVWGPAEQPSPNTLEVYIGYLRRKLEAAGEPRLIHTVRGVGYRLREAP